MLASKLSQRIKEIRIQRNGSDYIMLAEELGVPTQTWKNYENGVEIPSRILLQFLEITGANPMYLLYGDQYPMFLDEEML